MSELTLKEILMRLKLVQSPARFRHSCSVSKLAQELSLEHGENVRLASLAGLLHDWAKEWKPSKLMGYVKRHHISVPNLKFIKQTSPNLVHAYVGAAEIKRLGWIRDREWLKAIASHTLGSTKMSVPQKLLFVADFSSYDRNFRRAKDVRKIAFKNIHDGFAFAISLKIRHQLKKTKKLHPSVVQVWNQVVCKNHH